MFFVSDTQKERHELISSFMTPDRITIAVILAAIDFEWTIRRTILAMGSSPTKYIRDEILAKSSGYNDYKSAWKQEVSPRFQTSIVEVIPHWSRLTDKTSGAARLRGQILHGVRVTVSTEFASTRIDDLLSASELLEEFSIAKGKSVYSRIVRRKNLNTSV